MKAYFIKLTKILCLLAATHSQAADPVQLPPVNLGDTSFLDGIAGPGTLVQAIGIHSRSDQFNDSSGNALTGDNNIDISVLMGQYAVITEHKIWGGYYGWEILLPIVDIEPDSTFSPPLPNQGDHGLGDVIVSPFLLQWTDSSLFGRPYFHRLNMIFVLPTGRYDSDREVNAGQNHFRFNPYYAGTLMINSQLTASFRVHYLWNDDNDEPTSGVAAAFDADDIQAGSAFHINFASSYKFSEQWRAGIAGYYLKQLTRDRINGRSYADSKEQVFAIGPGLFFKEKETMCALNSYFESSVENRAEGYRVVARCGYVFH
jgi:hypothetical protein